MNSLLSTALAMWITTAMVVLFTVGVGWLVARKLEPDFGTRALRCALWVGVGLTATIFMLAGSVTPSELLGGVVLAPVAGVGLLLLLRDLRQCDWWRGRRTLAKGAAGWVWLGITMLALMAVTVSALGMPTNYDAGLYQLNAIQYEEAFGVVPGLANIHDRLGFNSSVYPMAAALGQGLWSGQGFRLVTATLLLSMSADVALRLGSGTSRRSPGTAISVIGLAVIIAYSLQEPGRLIASPVADLVAAVLTVISAAYLVDTLVGPQQWQSFSGGLAILLAALAATARPLGWLFFVGVVLVVAWAIHGRIRSSVVVTNAGLSAVLGLTMMLRDYLLSGWLLFPLGWFRVGGDWTYPDPTATREAISAWARAPHQSPEVAAHFQAWFPQWVLGLRQDWTVVLLIGMLVATAGLLVVSRKARRSLVTNRRGLVAMIPILISAAAWFATAPDPRFGWGYLLTLGLVPLALSMINLPSLSDLLPLGAAAVMVLGVVLAGGRGAFLPVIKDVRPSPVTFVGITWERALAPVKGVATKQVTLSDGTEVLEPIDTLQCWQAFPLCRLPGSPDDVKSRGATINDGFAPR